MSLRVKWGSGRLTVILLLLGRSTVLLLRWSTRVGLRGDSVGHHSTRGGSKGLHENKIHEMR